jgi:hypothetical protein
LQIQLAVSEASDASFIPLPFRQPT